jgi:hypothetical protein
MTAKKAKTIHEHLVEAASSSGKPFAPRTASEAEHAYVTRLVSDVANPALVSDDAWKALPDEVRLWHKDAAEKINAMQAPPALPGFQTEIQDLAPEATSPAPASTSTATDAAPAPAAESPKGKRGVMLEVRKLTLLNPDWKPEQIKAHLEAEGWPTVNLETAWLSWQEVKNVLKAIQAVGWAVGTAAPAEAPAETVAA